MSPKLTMEERLMYLYEYLLVEHCSTSVKTFLVGKHLKPLWVAGLRIICANFDYMLALHFGHLE